MKKKSYQICNYCIMDTSDLEIKFDDEGKCNHCKNYVKKVAYQVVSSDKKKPLLNELKQKIIQKGKGKKYDCVIGVSGGVDSSFVALLAKDLDLRALLVHIDNGWNSDISVKNIKNIAKKTGFDLYTHVINWIEFRDLQRALFKSSVVDIELATDHAIKAILFRISAKFGIKYMLNGGNVITEAIMPVSWRHTKADKRNLLDIHRRFGSIRLKSFPTASLIKQQLYKQILGINNIKILNYVEFDRDNVISRLKNELEWRDYGGKHHESIFTRFYQAYILPKKFGIDKRRCHYSNLICAGQLTRDNALVAIEQPVYDLKLLASDKEFILKKLMFSKQEFDNYIDAPEISHFAYKSDQKLIKRLQKIRRKFRKGGDGDEF
jgi:N-acetyl sugar amidotransferase